MTDDDPRVRRWTSTGEAVKVYLDWDSGPMALYGRAPGDAPLKERDRFGGGGCYLMPESLIARYEAAQAEFQAAEDAIREWGRTHTPDGRPTQ